MPLAHLTLQRFWQANSTLRTSAFGTTPASLFNTAELVATYFGYGGTANYCRVN